MERPHNYNFKEGIWKTFRAIRQMRRIFCFDKRKKISFNRQSRKILVVWRAIRDTSNFVRLLAVFLIYRKHLVGWPWKALGPVDRCHFRAQSRRPIGPRSCSFAWWCPAKLELLTRNVPEDEPPMPGAVETCMYHNSNPRRQVLLCGRQTP